MQVLGDAPALGVLRVQQGLRTTLALGGQRGGGAVALGIEQLDAVGQRERQEHHLGQGAELVGVLGPPGARHQAQRAQHQQHHAGQERRQAEDEKACLPHAGAIGRDDGGREDQHRGGHRHQQQDHRHAVVHQYQWCRDQRRQHEALQAPMPAPHAARSARHVGDEGGTEAQRGAKTQQGSGVAQQRRMRPQQPGGVATVGPLKDDQPHQVEHVVEIGAVTDQRPQEGVVDRQRKQHRVIEAVGELIAQVLAPERALVPQFQRQAERPG